MRRAAGAVATVFLCAMLAEASPPDTLTRAPATAPRGGARGASVPRVRTVTLGIRHRVFADFTQSSEVRMKQNFQVGDSPYTARVVEFVPDFSLDLETRKVVSLSSEPKNPAFRVIVKENGAPSDTAWAFLNMPPHFSRRSMLAFQVLRIDFVGRTSIAARDTALLLKGRP